MSTGKKLLLASIGRTILSLTQIGIGFFLMPFLLQHLGTRWYGIWAVLSSIVAYFYLMDVGLGHAVQLYCARHIATRDYDRANAVVNTALVIYCVIALLVLIATAVLAMLVGHFVEAGEDIRLISVVLLIVGLNIALEFPVNAFAGIIGAFSRFDLLSYSRFSMLLVSSASTFYFVGKGYGVLALAIIGLICGQMSNILFILISKYCFKEMRIGIRWFSREQVRELANYSAWSMLSSMSGLVKYKMQPLIIAIFSGPVAVAHYVVGSRLSDYFRDILFQATNLAMPVLAKYHVLEQTDQIREKLLFLTKVNTILSAFGAGVIAIVGRPFIARWLGAEFVDAYSVLVVLVFAMAVEIMLDPAKTTMTAMGKLRFVGVLEMAEALVNILLTVVLVRTYGMLGAALGMALPLLVFKLLVVPRALGGHLGIRAARLYRAMVPPVLVISGYLLAYALLLNRYFVIDSYPEILLTALAPLPLGILLAYCLFAPHELNIIERMLPFRLPQFGRRTA